jgi:hypothetical protein
LSVPIYCTWDGEALQPRPHSLLRCQRDFVIGEIYALAEHKERSPSSHRHYFAAVHEAWKNLPEDVAPFYPTSEHLRKAALVKAGYADEKITVFDSEDDARKAAALLRAVDDYVIVLVVGNCLHVFTAKSQSLKAMGKRDFQDSKQAVLEIVSAMIGVEPATLSANTQKAA